MNGSGPRNNGSVRSKGYRLRMSPLARALRVGLFVVLGLLFVPGILAGIDLWWRVVSGAGLIASGLALRTVLGPVVVVREKGLRIQRNWPLRRDVTWYRILTIDVIPGFWNLEVELNSGERLSLPCVEDLDDLYERMETHRQALDA